MVAPLIAVSARHDQIRIALLKGGILSEYHLWNPDHPDEIGALYTGRIAAAAPAMAGKFVDLGMEQSGFLPDSAGGKTLAEGAFAAFEIVRAAQGGKGVRLALAPSEPPSARPGLTRPGPGPLLDLAGRYHQAKILLDDHGLIARLRPVLEGRMSYQATTFHAALEDEIAELAEPTQHLPNGAALHFEFTKALTCIDIDTGHAAADRGAKSHAQLAFNLAILPELARQIVLRNLSGGILIDFAGMKTAARPKLEAPLRTALAADPQKPTFLGFSNLGYAEISRPRLRPPLHEMLQP